MSRWLIAIDGDSGDVDQYPTWFPDGSIFAMRKDDRVYLTGTGFDQLTTAEEVHRKADETLREFAAVIWWGARPS